VLNVRSVSPSVIRLSVGNDREFWKNGRLDRDAVRMVGRVGPKNDVLDAAYITWEGEVLGVLVYSVRTIHHFPFGSINVLSRSKMVFTRNLLRCNSEFEFCMR